MQLRFDVSLDSCQLLQFSTKMFLFAILCGGYVVGQVRAQYHGNPDHVVFPGPVSMTRNLPGNQPAEDSGVNVDTLVPVNLAKRLNSIESVDEFLDLLQNVPKSEVEYFSVDSRVGDAQERSSAVTPEPGKCKPELQPVSLKLDDDPSIIVYPLCTRIKRCGGCCSSSLLSCQPVATETRNFEVVTASLKNMSFMARQIVPLEEHTKCKCDCKIKEEDCNDRQHYEQDNCVCVCNNADEVEKCLKNNDTKFWNTKLCVCSCRNIEPCNTGYYFNHNTCRCGPIIFPRSINRSASTKSSNYNFANRRPVNVPPVIIPLDPSDPRRKHKEDPEY